MVNELELTFSALADPTRFRVVDLLRSRELCASELAESCSVSGPAMSRHLRVLRTHGLVEEDHAGADARVRVYRLRHEPFRALRRWLEDVEAFWTRELDAFKQHAERTRGPGKIRS